MVRYDIDHQRNIERLREIRCQGEVEQPPEWVNKLFDPKPKEDEESAHKKLERIIDACVEDILKTPDGELLKEEGDNASIIAREVNSVFERVLKQKKEES